MQSAINIASTDLTRQERLLIWLRRAGITNVDIARKIGVSSSMSVTRWFNAESIPTRRHRQLVDFGIPAELLPPALDITPGPRPRGGRSDA